MDHTRPGAFIPRCYYVYIMEGKSPKLSDPNSVRDFIYVDDIAWAFGEAFTRCNIGTGVQSSHWEVVKLLCSELGSTIELTWG